MTTEQTTEVRPGVAAGVTLLDQKRPGWHNEIDLDDLYLGFLYKCVLGQLYGSFGLGLRALGLSETDIAHGFDTHFGYDDLTAEWKTVISDRRRDEQEPRE